MDDRRDRKRDRMVVAAAFGLIIAYSVWQQGNGVIVSLGAGALAAGLYALVSRAIFGGK